MLGTKIHCYKFKIQICMFGSPRFNGFPDTLHKKIKPNQDSVRQFSTGPSVKKNSILSKLKERNLEFKCDFQQPLVSQFNTSGDIFQQQREPHSTTGKEVDSEEEEIAPTLNLNRKLTCFQADKPQEDLLNGLSLYRNNSTCDQARQSSEVKLGDNIYLRKINSKDLKVQRTSFSKADGIQKRLNQDYQIEENLGNHHRYHVSYICLNKLERIFYYVKKVRMIWKEHKSYLFLQDLVSSQVKIYNDDSQGHFIAFHQMWFEEDFLFLTFESALQSLEDQFRRHRLREIEAWDLLKDACSALDWLSKSHGMNHLNITPGNILKCQRKFKLADPFCFKQTLKLWIQREGQNASMSPYVAPEIRNFSTLLEGLNFAQADIYSLGMCLIENILGERYFPRQGKSLRAYLKKHLHGYSPALVRTLLGMVSLDPRKRPTAEDLCRIQGWQQHKNTRVRRFSI